jgi:hypothetical protein
MSQGAIKAFDFFNEQIKARSPKEVKESAMAALDLAIEQATYHKAPMGGSRILGAQDVKATGWLKDHRGITSEEVKDLLAGFLVSKGNLSPDRTWIYHKETGIYISFPSLMIPGRGGVAQWALADKMSATIEAGRDSNLLEFIKRGGFEPSSEGRKYFFAKGYTLLEDKDEALRAKEDIGKVLMSMEANRGVKDPKPKLSLDYFTLQAVKKRR